MPVSGSARYAYRCQVLDWIDGDTLHVDADLGFSLHLHFTVRVAGIDAPELHGETKAAGVAALNHARTIAPAGCFVIAQTAKSGDKFGRWLAKVTLDDGRDFAAQMIAAGHAKSYDGGARA